MCDLFLVFFFLVLFLLLVLLVLVFVFAFVGAIFFFFFGELWRTNKQNKNCWKLLLNLREPMSLI